MTNFFDEFLTAGRDLIRIPSVEGEPVEGKPFGEGVARALDFTFDVARSLGFRVVNNGYYYGYAEIGEGELFGILGHLDTVPFGEGWDYPPTSAEIVDGVLYGRGVLDDKLPVFSTLYAVKELVENGLVPNKRIRIIFGCNEESGWQCIKKYVECEEMPKSAFSPDSDFPVIFAEKGVLHYSVSMPLPRPLIRVKGGERPNMVLDRINALVESSDELATYLDKQSIPYVRHDIGIELHFDGISAHGSTPDKGVNASHKLLKVLSDVYGNDWTRLYNMLSDITGGGVNLAISDEVSGALTMNVGTMNSTENSLLFSLDIRYPISYKEDYIYRALTTAMPNAKIVVTGSHDPLYIDKNSALVTALLDSYNEYAKDNAEPIAIGGATYARALDNAVAFGPVFPGRESTIHQKNERVSLADLEMMYDIYKLAIRKLCFD